MENLLIPNDLRSCRDLMLGRPHTSEEQLTAKYAALRSYLRRRQPPFKGERLRKSTLALIGALTALISLYCMLVA